MTILNKELFQSRAWPVEQARLVLEHLDGEIPEVVLLETGYGPSGLPHIGTFGEVKRTAMVAFAIEALYGVKTKLICFSDDLDGLRKVPDNIPEEYSQYLGLPLTAIPDPFGTHSSYGAHMNSKLIGFLDTFGFQYEFLSATQCYKSGMFNEYLMKALEKYDEIMDIMLPTLREERSLTYSPFMPICPKTGKVLQVQIVDRSADMIAYMDEGCIKWISVKDGNCKLQWKPDFAMRWAAFGIHFEMYGKDHLVNGPIYSRICTALGKKPPHQMYYELFLDQDGQKISKSKGNGVTIDEWLRFAPPESLSLFMFLSPQKAKKLYFDIIPKSVEEYLTWLRNFHSEEDPIKRFSNPVYFIHKGNPPQPYDISYSMLLNLVTAANITDKETVLGYVFKFYGAECRDSEFVQQIVCGVLNYYQEIVLPLKKHQAKITTEEKALLLSLQEEFSKYLTDDKLTSENIQNALHEFAKRTSVDQKQLYMAVYKALLNSSQGPRFGSFVMILGLPKFLSLLRAALTSCEEAQ